LIFEALQKPGEYSAICENIIEEIPTTALNKYHKTLMDG
jgi:hypothetical protein